MSDSDSDAFRRSLELARAALYASDHKRRAMEAIKRMAAGQERLPGRSTDAVLPNPGASKKEMKQSCEPSF